MNHLYTVAHKRRLEAQNDWKSDVGVILSMKQREICRTTRNGTIKN